MRIIKHGNQIRHMTCTRCNCEFEFTLKEIKVNEYYEDIFHTNFYTREKFINCPECKEKLIIEQYNVGGNQ